MATVLDTFVTLFEYKVVGFDSLKKKALAAKQIGNAMTMRMTLPIVAFAAVTAKLASDMEETQNKIRETFGESASNIEAWSAGSINSMGLAQQSAMDTAALFGDMGVGMGQTQEQALEMSKGLTQLSADMASFKNVRQSIVQTALASTYTGETESLKKLGIVMTEQNLKQFAMREGLNANLKALSQTEKVLLRYKFIMDSSSNSHGDFVRTGGGAANQARKLTENFKEFGVVFGGTILPLVTAGLVKINAVVLKATQWWAGLSEPIKDAVVALGLVLALAGPVISAISGVALAVAALGIAFAATPLGAALVIVGALVAAFSALYVGIRKFRAGGSSSGFGSTVLPVAAQRSVGATNRSRISSDNRVYNVDAPVTVNEATDGKKVQKQFTENLGDAMRTATQDFRTSEAG